MRHWVRTGIRRFGQNVVIRSSEGDEQNVQAFLQPVLQSGEALVGEFSSAGWIDQRRWRYIGQAPLETDDLILWQGFAFRVKSCREVHFQNAACYWQASLEREKEDRV